MKKLIFLLLLVMVVGWGGAAKTASWFQGVNTQDLNDNGGGSSAFPYDQWKASTATSTYPQYYYTHVGQSAPGFGTIVVTVSGAQYVEQATTAGTTGTTEPTWDTVTGHTNTDGTATWTTEGNALSCDLATYQRCLTELNIGTQWVVPYKNPASKGTVVEMTTGDPTVTSLGEFAFPSPLFTGVPIGTHTNPTAYVPGMKFIWTGTAYQLITTISGYDWGSNASNSGVTSLTANSWNNVGSIGVTNGGEYTPAHGRYATDWICLAYVTNAGGAATTFNMRIQSSGATSSEQDGITIPAGATQLAMLMVRGATALVYSVGVGNPSCQIEPAVGATLQLAQYGGSFPATVMGGGNLQAWPQ